MASKFEQLMANYGKIKTLPMDGPLPPLADKPDSQSQDQEASSQEEPIRQTIPSEAVLQKFLKSED